MNASPKPLWLTMFSIATKIIAVLVACLVVLILWHSIVMFSAEAAILDYLIAGAQGIYIIAMIIGFWRDKWAGLLGLLCWLIMFSQPIVTWTAIDLLMSSMIMLLLPCVLYLALWYAERRYISPPLAT